MQVSVIIPTYKNKMDLALCLSALEKSTIDIDPIIIDNEEEPMGFTKAVNRGLLSTTSEYMVILNDDTEVTPECVEKLLEMARQDPSVGIVGACAIKSVIHPIVRRGSVMADCLGGHTLIATNLPYVLNCVAVQFHGVLITRTLLQTIGILDEGFINYCSDLDYCLMAKMRGFKVMYRNDALIVHKEHGTMNRIKSTLENDQQYFIYKWLSQGVNELLFKIPLEREECIGARLNLILDGKPDILERFKRRYKLV